MKKRRHYVYLCICILILLFPLRAQAEEKEESKLCIQYPIGNVAFSFYQVASFGEEGRFQLVLPFSKYAEEITGLENLETMEAEMTADTWRTLANSLESYVISQQVNENFSGIVGANGKLVFRSLPNGLYLILAETVESDGEIYTPAPVLVTIPNRNEMGEWSYQVEIDYSGKVAVDEIFDTYCVQKIWNDDHYEEKRPKEVEVELYKEGDSRPYDSVILMEENQWKHVWEKLPYGEKWIVSEKNVPKEYTVKYSKEGNTFVIENQYKKTEKPSNGGGGKLPQTGQVWWPVPVLTFLGILCFTAGWIRRNDEVG